MTTPDDAAPEPEWETRLRLSPKMRGLLEETARLMDTSPKWCLRHLFKTLEELVDAGEELDLGAGWPQLARAARAVRDRHEDAREQAEARNPDLTKLHRSNRAKSGYVGVYSNGNGFRAEGKDPNNPRSVVTIGNFKTAEQAALARLAHHRRHGLVYGQLEEEMAKMLQRDEHARTLSEERLKHEVIWLYANALKRPIEGLTDEERLLEQIDPHTAEVKAIVERAKT